MNTECEQALEKISGYTLSELQDTPIDEIRRQTEQKLGHPLEPINSLTGEKDTKIISHAEVDALLLKAIA